MDRLQYIIRWFRADTISKLYRNILSPFLEQFYLLYCFDSRGWDNIWHTMRELGIAIVSQHIIFKLKVLLFIIIKKPFLSPW